MPDPQRLTRRPRRLRALLIATGALGIGVALGVAPAVIGSDRDASRLRVDRQRSVQKLSFADTAPVPGGLSAAALHDRFRNQAETPAEGAATGRAAVREFLAGELANDPARSFVHLSASARQQYPNTAAWGLHHRSVIAPFVGYTVQHERVDLNRTTVDVVLRFVPSLDETSGLVPRDATARFLATRAPSGWFVDIAATNISPRFLDSRGAEPAARAWVTARQACVTAQQWRTSLYGDGAQRTAAGLCRQPGVVATAPVRDLSGRTDTAALLAAFGPEVGRWARVVPVTAPSRFDLVLAPLDRSWVVVAVLTDTSGQGQG